MAAIPIIRLRNVLIVSVQGDLTDTTVLALKEALTDTIERAPADGLVIDISGVDLVDTYMARAFRDLSQIVRLMGVQTVLAGLDPAMAGTLVEMGMTMEGVHTALNLEAALELLGLRISTVGNVDDPFEAQAATVREEDELFGLENL